MAASSGVICGAGFETPSEALYLGKPLLAVPMRGQLGVTVLDVFSTEVIPSLRAWLEERPVVDVYYPDDSQRIVRRVLESALRPLQKAQ